MIRRSLSTLVPTVALVGASLALGPIVTSEGGGVAASLAPVDLAGAVGFVDMEALKDGYPGTAAREEELRELVKGFQDRMAALQKEVTDAEVDVEVFQEGTDQRLNARLKLSLKRLEAEETVKILEAKSNRERLRIGVELYAEIERGIADFATKRGMQIVFRTFPGADDPRAQLDENRSKDVVYHKPTLDVTKAVSDHLKTWKAD